MASHGRPNRRPYDLMIKKHQQGKPPVRSKSATTAAPPQRRRESRTKTSFDRSWAGGRTVAGSRGQSRRTTLRRELLIFKPPLYSMKPSLRNLFMKKFTRDRVVPTISASVSCDSLGTVRKVVSSLP